MDATIEDRLAKLERVLGAVGAFSELELVRFLQKHSDELPGGGSTDVTAALEASGRLWVPGDLKSSARSTPDAGFLACDGAAVSRTTYASLYAAIGTVFGVGDGSTTFNVPDYRGRALVGAGAGTGLTARALGAKLGAETLVIADLPPHSHTGTTGNSNSDLNHNHSIVGVGTYGGQFGGSSIPFPTGFSNTGAVDLNHNHNFTTNNTGGGAADSRFQPSTVCNIFIKY